MERKRNMESPKSRGFLGKRRIPVEINHLPFLMANVMNGG